jgi:LmbE family N-acetylglucosaminyl deacetylase
MFKNPLANIFIPYGMPQKQALEKTTHLAIAAHPDDVEMMAIEGIVHCFDHPEDSFTAVVMTDGGGSPRSGKYADFTDEDMIRERLEEQKKAATIGKYGALVSLMFSSGEIKNRSKQESTDDLVALFQQAKPKIVYTHNLADKHPTHVAVALRVIEAIRQIEPEARPERLLGCELWRSLDWLPDSEKVALDCSTQIDLQEALISVFDSQISGGKRYDLAAMGRRVANATYYHSHKVDEASHLTFAMDLTPLIVNPHLDIVRFVNEKIEKFQKEVVDLLKEWN